MFAPYAVYTILHGDTLKKIATSLAIGFKESLTKPESVWRRRPHKTSRARIVQKNNPSDVILEQAKFLISIRLQCPRFEVQPP